MRLFKERYLSESFEERYKKKKIAKQKEIDRLTFELNELSNQTINLAIKMKLKVDYLQDRKELLTNNEKQCFWGLYAALSVLHFVYGNSPTSFKTLFKPIENVLLEIRKHVSKATLACWVIDKACTTRVPPPVKKLICSILCELYDPFKPQKHNLNKNQVKKAESISKKGNYNPFNQQFDMPRFATVF